MGTEELRRDDRRVILHFDYDCFYAAVFENEDPKLRFLPLAVQQKQIIVTCNYEARRRGLYKLQRITEARQRCPEAIIMLGEDLNRFRNASKENYNFLRNFAWSGKIERLGFDEVFIDVTDMVDYNVEMINPNALHASFFQLSRHDPTVGFDYDCRTVSGHTIPATSSLPADAPLLKGSDDRALVDGEQNTLRTRLVVGSHLAQHLRHQLEEHQGYTSTVGISTSKLISKLAGNVNKPKSQTTILPPYSAGDASGSNTTRFLDGHDIGKIPGLGFKSAQRIRDHVLGRPAAFVTGLVYGGTKEKVTVKDVRLYPSMGAELLEKLLGGAGAPKGIGSKVWGLINGVDDSEVSKAREIPHQISIEDSYIRLSTTTAVVNALKMLAKSLLFRMREDLLRVYDDDKEHIESASGEYKSRRAPPIRQWQAYPRTLRLTTRPRPPLNPDGTRSRTFNRISRSCDMPSFILNLSNSVEELSERLVQEALIPLFHKVHPEKPGFNLSLLNLCATNMAPTAASAKDGAGRDISKMFKMQEHARREWRADDNAHDSAMATGLEASKSRNENAFDSMDAELDASTRCVVEVDRDNVSESTLGDCRQNEDIWQSDDEILEFDRLCTTCGLSVPQFATAAHDRFHNLPG